MRAVVARMSLPADKILNLGSPRYLPEVWTNWSGRNNWWHPRYDALRDLMEVTYLASLNRRDGLVEYLNGRLVSGADPFLVTAGSLIVNRLQDLPPSRRNVHSLITFEGLDGIRLLLAQRNRMKVPCIVNDYTGRIGQSIGAVRVKPTDDLARLFGQTPSIARWMGDGSLFVDGWNDYFSLNHRKVRCQVVAEVRNMVADWMQQND